MFPQQERHPGDCNRVLRARFLEFTKNLLLDFQASITKGNKMDVKAAFQKWEATWTEVARNPTYVPQLTTKSLDDYCDMLTLNVGEFYLCRFDECRMIVRAHQWVQNHKDPLLAGRDQTGGADVRGVDEEEAADVAHVDFAGLDAALPSRIPAHGPQTGAGS